MIKSLRRFGTMMIQHCLRSAVSIGAVRCVAATGLFLLLSTATAFAAFLPPQTITNTATFDATGIPTVTSNTVIVTPLRTPAVIKFKHFDATTNNYIPADVYHAGQRIYVEVADGDQNTDPLTIETVTITLVDTNSGDTETIILTETGTNTGVFIGGIASTRSKANVPANNILSVSEKSIIEATYTDGLDPVPTVASAALVDPLGVVFDAASGALIDGATVQIINTATGLPATVFGDDAVSLFPSTLTSGGTATDASGSVYNFGPGEYRFPFMNPGTYRIQVTPPAGFSAPSQATPAAIATLPVAPPFSIVAGSYGDRFAITAGPALHIDIPVDATGANLFIRKSTPTPLAAIGDRVHYEIQVENVHPTSVSTSTLVKDTLPLGFRYQSGSAQLDGVALADPIIAKNGRDITFNLGTLAAATAVKLSYVTVVGANTKPGIAENTAIASGSMGAIAVSSNISKASVTIREDLIRNLGFIVGVVFVDENMNELQDDGELGVEGVRVFMEDGRSSTTDQDGRYHFDGVKLGTHVLQMDRVTIAQRYEAIGLTQTRFAGNHFSQFAEVRGGGLVRANFRVVNRPPASTPVKVVHTLDQKDGLVWAEVVFEHSGEVELHTLDGFYGMPKGWKYVPNTAALDGVLVEPTVTPSGLTWPLQPANNRQTIQLAMRGGGERAMKQAIAYARFTSAGTEKGRTDLATLHVQDTMQEDLEAHAFTLHIKFDTRRAIIPEAGAEQLEMLVRSLNGLVIREMIVEGHTDNIRIAPENRHEFADNKALSESRALFVAKYLAEKLQLEEGFIQAVGMGEVEPIATNATPQGREMNRRVVLKIKADKVSHDFSTTLQDRLAQANGQAAGSWDVKAVQDVEKIERKTTGVLSPASGSSLPHAITAVRVALDSKLKMELTVDGVPVKEDRIGFKAESPETGLTTYTFIGVDFGKVGEHVVAVRGSDPFGNIRFEEAANITRTGEVAKIKLVETAENIADGRTPIRFRLAITDSQGVKIKGGLELAQLGGDLKSSGDQRLRMLAEETSQTIKVDRDGWVTLDPVATSGSHHITLAYNNVQEKVELYIKPETREWIMVGFGEGTVGFNKLAGATQPITDAAAQDGFYKDGQIAFYAKGQIPGNFLMTLAYDTTAKTDAEKQSRFGDLDPNVMYTVYGDNTIQQFDATSSRKLYVKIERDTFYALFGDFNTGLSTTELTRYSRVFTGVKAELHEDKIGFTAFATQTSQTMVRDEIRGNGTSGLYQLSRKNIIQNTDVIRIETVDRFKSEVILSSIQLTRHLDYDLDYVTGTVWFKQPVLSKDAELNPMMIRIEYESNDQTDQFTTAGGRIYVKPTDNLEFGGTYISEGRLGVSNTLSGADASLQVSENVEVRAEVAESIQSSIPAQAWKVEALMTDEQLSGKVYARQQDDNFGLGQQLGSENSTRKVGADGTWRFNPEDSLNAEMFRQEVMNTGAKRDMASVNYNTTVEDLDVVAGLRGNQDQDGTGAVTSSALVSLGASKDLTSRITVHANHEQALSDNNGVDFPTRSILGADYRVTENTSLVATQEWTRGQAQDTSSSRLGINTQPWNGAQMSASFEQQLSEDGDRSFANAGLLQSWQISEALSFSASIDRTTVVSSATPAQMNRNAPTATGGEGFTAYSVGADYRPADWLWTNRLEYRTSDISKHHGASLGLQGKPMDELVMQFTMLWQKDALVSATTTLTSDASLRAAWRPAYDQLILLDRLDVRRSEITGSALALNSKRYINNLTANWQSYDSWQLRLNHGIKFTDQAIASDSWSGITDLLGIELIYDFNDDWDVTAHTSALRVRHLAHTQPSAGMAVGYNMFDNFWLSMGYNFVGFYDQDFTAAEYSREGIYMRFRFKFDQNSLEEMLK